MATTRKLLGIDAEELTVEQEKKLQEFKRIFFNEFGLILKFEIVSHETSNYCFIDCINPFRAIYIILNYTEWDWYKLISSSRKEDVVLGRSIIFYILYCNGCSINDIAKIFDRSHSTIISSLRTFNKEIEWDGYSKKLLRDIVINLRDHYEYSKIETKEQLIQKLKEV